MSKVKQSFVTNDGRVLQGSIVKPILKEGRIIEYLMDTSDIVVRVNSFSLFNEDLVAMFPSDLSDTMLEDIWVKGYDSTLEENQDRYMSDFWKWCESNCTSKDTGYGGHTVFKFEMFNAA